MAHFYPYEQAGTKITARHIGIRRFPLFRHMPYWIGSKPKFIIRSKTGKQVINSTIPVYEWWPGMKGEHQVGRIGPFTKEKEVKEILVTGFHIPADGALEYWIHQPKMAGSWKLADFRGNWKDQVWLMFLSALIGFLVGVLGQSIITMLESLVGK